MRLKKNENIPLITLKILFPFATGKYVNKCLDSQQKGVKRGYTNGMSAEKKGGRRKLHVKLTPRETLITVISLVISRKIAFVIKCTEINSLFIINENFKLFKFF